MGTYKVPQDVEAEDKLLGPFSFRQFVYLMIVGLMAVVAWFLGRLFLPLAIIPLPIIVFFGAIALPLRKDQPMETYLAAIVKFYLLPKKRIWDADGVETLIEITAPKRVEVARTKNITEAEAEKQLGYLATLVDTGGWSTRGVGSAINGDVYAEASTAEDVMDSYDPLSQSIDQLMVKKTAKTREELMQQMQSGAMTSRTYQVAPRPTSSVNQEPASMPAPVQPALIPASPSMPTSMPVYSSAAQPQTQVAVETPKTAYATSQAEPSPGIIKLATENDDLTVDIIAKQAQRIEDERKHAGEVYVSLR